MMLKATIVAKNDLSNFNLILKNHKNLNILIKFINFNKNYHKKIFLS